MTDYKLRYLGYIFIFCIVLALGGGYFLGSYFKEDVIVKTGLEDEPLLISKIIYDQRGNYYLYKDNLRYEGLSDVDKINSIIHILDMYGLGDVGDGNCIYTTNNNCYYKSFNKDTFENAYKYIYGADKEINYSSGLFTNMEGQLCIVESDKINCDNSFDETNYYVPHSYFNLEKAYMENNYLVLIVDTLVLHAKDEVIYKSMDNKEIIDDYNYALSIEDESYNDTDSYVNKLFSKYKGKTGRYSLKFKKEDNHYYWVESKVLD